MEENLVRQSQFLTGKSYGVRKMEITKSILNDFTKLKKLSVEVQHRFNDLNRLIDGKIFNENPEKDAENMFGNLEKILQSCLVENRPKPNSAEDAAPKQSDPAKIVKRRKRRASCWLRPLNSHKKKKVKLESANGEKSVAKQENPVDFVNRQLSGLATIKKEPALYTSQPVMEKTTPKDKKQRWKKKKKKQCSICYKWNSWLPFHMATRHAVTTHMDCPICQLSFFRSSLPKHIASHHPSSYSSGNIPCKYCDKLFYSMSLIVHIHNVHEQPSY